MKINRDNLVSEIKQIYALSNVLSIKCGNLLNSLKIDKNEFSNLNTNLVSSITSILNQALVNDSSCITGKEDENNKNQLLKSKREKKDNSNKSKIAFNKYVYDKNTSNNQDINSENEDYINNEEDKTKHKKYSKKLSANKNSHEDINMDEDEIETSLNINYRYNVIKISNNINSLDRNKNHKDVCKSNIVNNNFILDEKQNASNWISKNSKKKPLYLNTGEHDDINECQNSPNNEKIKDIMEVYEEVEKEYKLNTKNLANIENNSNVNIESHTEENILTERKNSISSSSSYIDGILSSNCKIKKSNNLLDSNKKSKKQKNKSFL